MPVRAGEGITPAAQRTAPWSHCPRDTSAHRFFSEIDLGRSCQQDFRVGNRGGEQIEKLLRLFIDPVQILEDHDQRLNLAHGVKKSRGG